MVYHVTVRYSDGELRAMPVDAGETILEAAEAHGVPVVNACQSGVCGTCVARCAQGSYDLANSIGLSESEKEQRRVLTCQTRVRSDCTIELDYPLSGNAARIVVGEGVITRIERLSPDTALLVLDISGLPERLEFKAGQFAQLKVPGTEHWRSFSFAHAPRNAEDVEFLIRILPIGVVSEYLRSACAVGDRIAIRASKGDFYLRSVTRPVLLMAGGTGLSAILSIAEQLANDRCAQPIRLVYGVTNAGDLVLLQRLRKLAIEHPQFTWDCVVRNPSPDWHGSVGLVTDLLSGSNLYGGDIDIYLCGPSAMVDAVRGWLQARGLQNATLYYEKFVPSGARRATSHIENESPLDTGQLRHDGRGTAVVIGGSIAGICAAKVLSETFRNVIVIEKDQDHRPKEGRNGAAQGWHLHHLLIAGQRQLETVFPGIIDDMVSAGAFKVDMGEQYRLMIAGSWKKVTKSGVDIVCAGRPLLEWCLRRRLDREPAIEYRYDSSVTDLVVDQTSNTVVGVAVEHDGRRDIIPAEFVVDAAGKNTPVPEALFRLGFGAPSTEEDQINCFYSTMQHRVRPERAWRDKVMVICYAHRPQQQYYAAQFFTDSSRTVLSTCLVGYNCYEPPRNAKEFREFARRMPSHAIGNELDGLEPCSPVYNFRYPTILRHHYERMLNLPAGLVAVGDSFCSADPVSGAGMSMALLELNELRTLLRMHGADDPRLVQCYYKTVGRIADRAWAVIREQNLRYPWIKNVEEKRPFYFPLQNWYVDRVFESMHDDLRIYRLYLAVSHLIAPFTALMKPAVVARVLGKWLWSRLRRRETLIQRNFGEGRMGDADSPTP